MRIHEHGQVPDGTAYLAMEFLQGETLSARLRRYQGPMPEAEACRIAWQLASGLAAAHKKSIVHRDLKPGNIMLVPEGSLSSLERVKLLDFGIAKLDVVSLNLEDPLTRTGALMGTPHYMSPEQCKGARSVDDRADVYALGVILFQMLTGRLPFLGEGEGTVLAMHIYEQPPRPRDLVPSISEAIQDLILQMLRKDKDARPSMFLVTRRLEELGATVGNTSDLSMTFEEMAETVPGEEQATVMRPPGGSAASTVVMSGLGHQSSPMSGLAHQSSPSQPSTFGPVTGQVGTINRYGRPIVAGAAGVFGVVGVIALALLLMRQPTQPPLIKTAGLTTSPTETSLPPANVPGTTGTPKIAVPRPTPHTKAKVHGKSKKRHVLKHKPRTKSPSSSKSSVSVVD